jgi:hypothetical protein
MIIITWIYLKIELNISASFIIKPDQSIPCPPLPPHLPREEITIDIADKTCPCCGGLKHRIGEDVSERLEDRRRRLAPGVLLAEVVYDAGLDAGERLGTVLRGQHIVLGERRQTRAFARGVLEHLMLVEDGADIDDSPHQQEENGRHHGQLDHDAAALAGEGPAGAAAEVP